MAVIVASGGEILIDRARMSASSSFTGPPSALLMSGPMRSLG
jgi:hypothetical protein